MNQLINVEIWVERVQWGSVIYLSNYKLNIYYNKTELLLEYAW